MAATRGDVWEVVGGAKQGGIIVRTGKETSSAESSERLSTGAKVRVVESTASRIGYELISGDGPKQGWVTTKIQGKDLLVKLKIEGDEIVQSSKAPANGQNVLEEYCQRFGARQTNEEFMGFNRKAFPWVIGGGQASSANGDKVRAELEREMGLKTGALDAKEPSKPAPLSSKGPATKPPAPRFQLRGWAEDSDGEDVRVCSQCNLPLGDHAYNRGRDCVHGECMAQLMVQDLRDEDKKRVDKEREKKSKQHAAYGIGWNQTCIPRNDEAASKLAMRDIPQGMVCLIFQDRERTVRIASTSEPSAAMNLEYLSTALQVRRTEGHEPVFSLDPVNPDDKHSVQEKVFVPEWLAGTSAGDVLFQSDYHLKELSMGEFEQPIIGMKSCFDYSEIEEIHGWSAREWFLVRKAEVQISEGSMLIPMVKMGVEAREQVVIGNSLEDKPCTRPNHPMVKYAEAFTANFDLIAERKSVVFALRELAKASVMAKYLLDSRIQLEATWFDLATVKEDCCSLEVPQLWNERMHSQVNIKDGSIERDYTMHAHGVYGGVQFGLDKFNLATSIGRTGMPAASLGASIQAGPRLAASISAGQAGLSAGMPQHRLAFGLSRKAGVAPVSNIMSLASGAQFAPPSAALSASALPPARLGAALSAASIGAPRLSALSAASISAVPGQPRLQGVDLRLDKFDLSEARRVSLEAQSGSWRGQVKSLDQCAAVGPSFFASLDGKQNIFKADDKALLEKVFDPALSDRRSEGDLFVPPDASFSYVQKLRSLVKEEQAVRQRRKEHFLDQAFIVDKPGPLFPHSWTPNFEIARGRKSVQEIRPVGTLTSRPEYKSQAAVLEQVLKASAPVFDKTTEEGLRYRIYRLGSLEVRTTQELKESEVVGAVFSIRNQAPNSASAKAKIGDQEKITKVTEYVERAFVPGADSTGLRRRFYIMMETDQGHKIVTERLNDGKFSWVSNPEALEDRNSLAKVTRQETVTTGVIVRDMKACQTKLTEEGATPSSKRYAQALFTRAVGAKRSSRSTSLRSIGMPPLSSFSLP